MALMFMYFKSQFFYGILTEISLLNKYKQKIKFFKFIVRQYKHRSLYLIIFSLNGPENQLLCGIHYVYDTLGGI